MKKWIITLLFVFACLPVVAVKAAPSQAYIHLGDYEVTSIVGGHYDIVDGSYAGVSGTWTCSEKIQIPKNVDKLYFSGLFTHFVLFYNNDSYIGFYYEGDYVLDFSVGAEEKILGEYYYIDHMLDVPTNATHILLQSCNDTFAGQDVSLDPMPILFDNAFKPLIYYPAPADAADNITFGLMPALMIMLVITGLIGSLIMITKKSKR